VDGKTMYIQIHYILDFTHVPSMDIQLNNHIRGVAVE
jgi:hypothetical protein